MARSTRSDRYKIKRNRTLPTLIAVIALIGAAAVVWRLVTSFKVTPDKVLITVTIPETEGTDGIWWGHEGEASARFLGALREPMGEVGFAVIAHRAQGIEDVMEGARTRDELVSRARDLGAGVLVSGALDVTRAETLLGGKAVEVLLEGELEVLLTDTDAPEIKTIPVRILQVGSDREAAVQLAAQNAAELVFDEVVTAIITTPEVDALFDRSDRTSEQAEVAMIIKRAHNFVGLRRQAILTRDAVIEKASERWREQSVGPAKIGQLSPYGREDLRVGVMPNGAGVIAMVKERRTRMSLSNLMLTTTWEPERLDFIDMTGATHHVFEAYNIYGTAGLSRDGATLAVTTDEHGMGFSLRLIEIDPLSAAFKSSRQLVSIGPRGDLTYPMPSPDGSKILFQIRDCKRCNSSLEIIDADGKNRRPVFKADDWRGVGDAHWVGPDNNKVAYILYHEERPRRVFIRDLSTGKETLVHANAEISTINESFSPDGTLITYVMGGGAEGRQLVVKNLATGVVTPLTKDLYVKRPEISPNNKWVAFEATGRATPKDPYHRDHEIAVVPIGGGEVCYLTVNAFKDRHLMWSPDSKTVIFETVYKDPDSDDPWVALRSAKVE